MISTIVGALETRLNHYLFMDYWWAYSSNIASIPHNRLRQKII